jgi:hypothetical protein
MTTELKNLTPGRRVRFSGRPCYVLEHRPDGTLLLAKEPEEDQVFGKTNCFPDSDLWEYLNGAYLAGMEEADRILPREVDLTATNGSREYGSCLCKVAPLTLDEVRRYHGLYPVLKNGWEWTATPWSTPAVNHDWIWVTCLNSDGDVDLSSCSFSYGARPAFLVPSSLSVEALP